MSFAAKITSKGQITIPAKLRERLDVGPGDHLNFIEDEDGGIRVVKETRTIEELRGIIPWDGPPLSPDDLVDMVESARNARAAELVRRLEAGRK